MAKKMIRCIYKNDPDDTPSQKLIASILNESGLTQYELAELTDISRQSISSWVNGKTSLSYRDYLAMVFVIHPQCREVLHYAKKMWDANHMEVEE